MVERFFTPKEANRVLPQVRKVVEEILSAANDADISQERIKSLMAQLEEIGFGGC